MEHQQPTIEELAPSGRRWTVPAAVAAFVVIMVGGLASVVYVGGRSVGDAAATTMLAELGAEPVRFVPGLGELTWTRLEGPAAEFGDLGTGISYSREDGYRLMRGFAGFTWESADGLDWTFRDFPQGYGEFAFDRVGSGGYAIGSSADGRQMLALWTADGWVEIDDFGPITDTVGIVWRPQLDEPIQVGDAVAAAGVLEGELPWGEIYGDFQRSDCESDCRRRAPRATWDATAQRLHLVHPFDETPIASLTIDVEGDTATFVDVGTQEVVHQVIGTDGLPIEEIVGAIQRTTPRPRRYVYLRGNLVSAAGGGFGYLRPQWLVEPPLSNVPAILAAPDGSGFVAYEQVGDETTDPIDRDVVTNVRTWISEDGIAWTEAAAPPFPHPWAGGVIFSSGPGAIVAEVLSTRRSLLQLWESSDGLDWAERPIPPIVAPLRRMEFGYATAERVEDLPSSGRWRWRYWVLGDGDAWVEVVGPPAQPVAVGDGAYAWNHEVGSLLYWGYGDEDRDWLWVGRFDS